MRVAIVHHWFVTRGGGERVAECIAALFPQAILFTLLSNEAGLTDVLRRREIRTSFLQKLPLAQRFHRHMMPFYPAATESLDLRGFDLIVSSDSGPVKGIRKDPGALHICYCHSPMRYLWDEFESYRAAMGPLTRAAFTAAAGRLRAWDARAAQRVDWFLANSRYVANRIERCYGRESTVLYPPIDLFRASQAPRRFAHLLCVGRLVSYKKTEIVIQACHRLGRTLRIVGSGPEEARLKRLAGPHVTFLGVLPAEALWREYSECRALVFAAEEDFGMVPLEAQACGTPVIAFGAGGSLETVRGFSEESQTIDEKEFTGIYFKQQTADSVVDGIQRFESAQEAGWFQPETLQRWAAEFDTTVFLRKLREFVAARVPGAEAVMLPEDRLSAVTED